MANRVFIVEPQWNPSVENQAIARALRIGQEQPVLVTRYIVQDSVEQVGTHNEIKIRANRNRTCKQCKTTKEKRRT
jgi:SNF2 family DNA or RNA helicase